MRDTNHEMIELLSVSKDNNIYSSLIRHTIGGEKLKIRFGIDPIDYTHLKKILEFRPFENTGVAPYRYFFGQSYNKGEHENSAQISVRVEQLDMHKQYMFVVSRKYIANLFWFNSLVDKNQIEQMIEAIE